MPGGRSARPGVLGAGSFRSLPCPSPGGVRSGFSGVGSGPGVGLISVPGAGFGVPGPTGGDRSGRLGSAGIAGGTAGLSFKSFPGLPSGRLPGAGRSGTGGETSGSFFPAGELGVGPAGILGSRAASGFLESGAAFGFCGLPAGSGFLGSFRASGVWPVSACPLGRRFMSGFGLSGSIRTVPSASVGGLAGGSPVLGREPDLPACGSVPGIGAESPLLLDASSTGAPLGRGGGVSLAGALVAIGANTGDRSSLTRVGSAAGRLVRWPLLS